nr:PadR family transcriptional regulator [uncultured Devosia sp.]
MNVELLCLSVLQGGEASGYDIRERFAKGEEALFANASTAAIYSALAKLHDKGHVDPRVVRQDDKPDKKIYQITPAGHAAFVEQLRAAPRDDTFHSPFLNFLRFSHLVPADLVSDHVANHGRQLDAQIDQIDRLLTEQTPDVRCCWALHLRRLMAKALRDGLNQFTSQSATKPQKTEL